MRRLLTVAALAALITAVTANAEPVSPKTNHAANGRRIDYLEGQIVNLRVSIDRPVTVRLEPGEKVRSTALSDPAGWQVTTSRAANRLSIKAMQAQGYTNMAVRTDRRLYTFALTAQPASTADRSRTSFRLRYASAAEPASVQSASSGQLAAGASYRIRGDVTLRPTSVSDDGMRTYVDWPPDTSLPAVYVINDAGREALVNGNMRDGRYVIDSVEKHLVFRIDKRVSRAVRIIRGQAER